MSIFGAGGLFDLSPPRAKQAAKDTQRGENKSTKRHGKDKDNPETYAPPTQTTTTQQPPNPSIPSSGSERGPSRDPPSRSLIPIPSSESSARPRRPKKGNEIEDSNLRPHVLAKDRIRLWKTPWGIRNDELVRSKLPDGVIDRTLAAIHAAWAPKSTSSYAAGLLRFTQFCDEHGVSEEDRMPASHVLLSAFVAQNAGSVSGDAVGNWLSGLKAWHDANGAPWYGNERWVKLTKRTAEKMGSGFKREQRGPVTTKHLRALRAALNLNKPQDAAIWATATAAFWGCRRLGEVTVPSAQKFDPKYHATRSATTTRVNTDSNTSGTTILIPWTKSTKERGGKIILADRDDELCPEKARQNHLRVNASVPGDAPLFAYEAGRKKWSVLTKDAFLARCHHIWKNAGLLAVAGHSFRIGGSTEMLLAGVPCNVVAATGGWTSLAFLLYWRRLEHIVLLHVGKAYDKKRVEEVSNDFEQFRIDNGIVLVDVDNIMA
ncbi:hypothetical protein MKEN_01215300 [Mycena kentingensis (nom. inval.)]|nr:hypothetical protein MKEN_01215300 [Mycena kentingensis (nom. inval.)]